MGLVVGAASVGGGPGGGVMSGIVVASCVTVGVGVVVVVAGIVWDALASMVDDRRWLGGHGRWNLVRASLSLCLIWLSEATTMMIVPGRLSLMKIDRSRAYFNNRFRTALKLSSTYSEVTVERVMVSLKSRLKSWTSKSRLSATFLKLMRMPVMVCAGNSSGRAAVVVADAAAMGSVAGGGGAGATGV